MKQGMILVKNVIDKPIKEVWDKWTTPEHIKGWCFASAEWHCPFAENDLREGGVFKTRMEAKNGEMGFDFEGRYLEVKAYDTIRYEITGDKRLVEIKFFEKEEGKTLVEEYFEPEKINAEDLQREGWQAILSAFKTYCERC